MENFQIGSYLANTSQNLKWEIVCLLLRKIFPAQFSVFIYVCDPVSCTGLRRWEMEGCISDTSTGNLRDRGRVLKLPFWHLTYFLFSKYCWKRIFDCEMDYSEMQKDRKTFKLTEIALELSWRFLISSSYISSTACQIANHPVSPNQKNHGVPYS